MRKKRGILDNIGETTQKKPGRAHQRHQHSHVEEKERERKKGDSEEKRCVALVIIASISQMNMRRQKKAIKYRVAWRGRRCGAGFAKQEIESRKKSEAISCLHRSGQEKRKRKERREPAAGSSSQRKKLMNDEREEKKARFAPA